MNLDFDLGTMQLDELGMWIDPETRGSDPADSAAEDQAELPPLPRGAAEIIPAPVGEPLGRENL